jgi:hypothetical protein
MKKAVFMPVFALAVLASVSYAADTPISRFNSATPRKANILGTDFYAYKYAGGDDITGTATCQICDDKDNGFPGLISDGVAKIVFSNVKNGGAAIGLNASEQTNGTVNFSGCEGGLKYSYSGSKHKFKINDSSKEFAATDADEWKEVVVTTGLSGIKQFAWVFEDYSSTTAVSGSLAIKDFICSDGVFGGIVAPPEKGTLYYVLEDFTEVQSNGKSTKMDGYYWYKYGVEIEEEDCNASYDVQEDDAKFAKLTYTLGTTSGNTKTSAGIGVGPSDKPTAYYDFSHCTGFSYSYKGAPHTLKSMQRGATKDNVYKLEMPASETWKEQTVSLESANWTLEFATNKIWKFAWEVIDADGVTGSLSIDDFSCLGIEDAPPTIALATSSSSAATTPSSSSAGTAAGSSSSAATTPSSSSAGTVAGSSSSVATTTPSSSSTGTVAGSSSSSVTTTPSSSSAGSVGNSSSSVTTGGSSSSGTAGSTYAYCIKDDGTCLTGPFPLNECVDVIKGSPSNECSTPIILPKLVHNNALNAMQNAVNLQITGSTMLQVFDLKGNAVRTLKFEQGNYIVPLSDLPHGLYIVKASSASWKQTIKATVR